MSDTHNPDINNIKNNHHQTDNHNTLDASNHIDNNINTNNNIDHGKDNHINNNNNHSTQDDHDVTDNTHVPGWSIQHRKMKDDEKIASPQIVEKKIITNNQPNEKKNSKLKRPTKRSIFENEPVKSTASVSYNTKDNSSDIPERTISVKERLKLFESLKSNSNHQIKSTNSKDIEKSNDVNDIDSNFVIENHPRQYNSKNDDNKNNDPKIDNHSPIITTYENTPIKSSVSASALRELNSSDYESDIEKSDRSIV